MGEHPTANLDDNSSDTVKEVSSNPKTFLSVISFYGYHCIWMELIVCFNVILEPLYYLSCIGLGLLDCLVVSLSGLLNKHSQMVS